MGNTQKTKWNEKKKRETLNIINVGESWTFFLLRSRFILPLERRVEVNQRMAQASGATKGFPLFFQGQFAKAHEANERREGRKIKTLRREKNDKEVVVMTAENCCFRHRSIVRNYGSSDTRAQVECGRKKKKKRKVS